ncbi:MAG: transcriptional regulator [Desulfobacterales bacterium]
MTPDRKTIRQQIIALLSGTEMSARNLSQSLGIEEREIYDHLNHVQRSAVALGMRLEIRPSECLKCGFVFRDRARLTPPGRCPRCKGTYLQKPAFKLDRSK